MRPIRRLPAQLANQIAAGEVVERPASILKELVENSLDAGASEVRVRLEEGGIAQLQVEDNGHGLPKDALALALERHATSKIDAEDLVRLRWFGFRGEALPAIASVARLTLASRPADAEHGWEVTAEQGQMARLRPASLERGTRVTVEQVFAAVPARRKFLKSPRAEAQACRQALQRLALAQPSVAFRLFEGERLSVDLPACAAVRERLGQVWGTELSRSLLPVELNRDGLRITGLAGPATLSRANSLWQFIYVNGRAVRDRSLTGLVRAAYRDVMAPDRFPMLLLFVEIAPEQVDVNVHPAKSEVRFRAQDLVRSAIIRALKDALLAEPVQAKEALRSPDLLHSGRSRHRPPPAAAALEADVLATLWGAHAEDAPPPLARAETPLTALAEEQASFTDAYPLGAAVAQIHGTYIVAQSQDGLVLVDQHAAHERLVYEAIKAQWAEEGIARQALLIPQTIELGVERCELVLTQAEALAEWGLEVEAFGESTLIVRSLPALLDPAAASDLLNDLADEIQEWGRALSLEEKLHHVAKTFACYGSIRAGRRLSIEEMNALLRQIESTARAHQCNHGRPTYRHLDLKTLESLFERR